MVKPAPEAENVAKNRHFIVNWIHIHLAALIWTNLHRHRPVVKDKAGSNGKFRSGSTISLLPLPGLNVYVFPPHPNSKS